MKKIDTIDRGAKNKIICYILEEYDKDYRRTFKKSEFEDNLSLNEIIEELKELKELKYIKENRNTFTISRLGIKYIREILFNRNQYMENIKMQWSGIILSVTLALISNLIAIYCFDSHLIRIVLSLFELIMVITVFKAIEKINKM